MQEGARDHEQSLITYLQQLAAFAAEHRSSDLKYASQEGLILSYGRLWTAQRRPKPYTAKMAYKACFGNAMHLAASSWWLHDERQLTYVEGYAWGKTIPVLHAWCVDREGRVIDPTWKQEDVVEAAYFGIPFDWDWVREYIVTNGVYGVLGGEWSNVVELLREGLPAGAVNVGLLV